MDIWHWVQELQRELHAQGHDRLANLMRRVPSATCDGQHAEVEAIVPEAVALARSLDLPWAELFMRHWLLQSRVLHRFDVSAGTLQAVELLDFASRDGLRECPQSVCVTQDLANCYAIADPEGYIDERLAVTRETLARIDPSWPCFGCIGGELTSALLDAGRHEEVVELCLRSIHEAHARGNRSTGNFSDNLARAHMALGQNEQALKVLEAIDRSNEGTTGESHGRILRAHCLARLGRGAEGLALLPAVDAIEAQHYEAWARALHALVEVSALANDHSLGRTVRELARALEKRGALGVAARLHELGASLALLRERPVTADLHGDALAELAPRLRRPDVILARMKARLATAPRSTLASADESADDLLAACSDDPERDLAPLRAGVLRFPDHPGLALQLARALAAAGFREQAEAALHAALARGAAPGTLIVPLGELLIEAERYEALEHLLETHAGALPGAALWLAAEAHEKRGQHAKAVQALAKLLELGGPAAPIRRRLAALERARGELTAALLCLDALIESEPPGSDDWDRIVLASLQQDWQRVRDSTRRLGITLTSEDGPVEERWGLVRVRGRDENGREFTDYALRTGPATARTLGLSGPHVRERRDDWVVFEPVLLEPRAEGDAEPPLFAQAGILAHGGLRSRELDGVHPGEEAVAQLEQALAAEQVLLRVRSDESYQLSIDGEEQRGLYAFVVAPADLAPARLHELLTLHTAAWRYPCTWLSLASEAGDAVAVERQRVLAERYGL